MDYNYLEHHGIKGMKWGVRRFRNKNGTLTAAGKKRYSEASDDAKAVYSMRKKRVYELSNAELRKANERFRLEQEYRRLNPTTINRGMAIAAGITGIMATTIGLYNQSNNLVKVGKEVVKKFGKK